MGSFCCGPQGSTDLTLYLPVMDWLTRLMAVALGGALGAVSRYLVSGWINRLAGASPFPYGTLTVNLVGCFLLGLLMSLGSEGRWGLTPQLRLLLGAGFLGALTTFSTFSFETIEALRAGEARHALANVGLSVVAGLVACWLGLRTGEQL